MKKIIYKRFKRVTISIGLLLTTFVSLQSCDKFLEEKLDYSFTTPEKLSDLRAVLDNESVINQNFPGLLEVGTDDYYVADEQLGIAAPYLQSVYLWSDDMEATDLASWTRPYESIMVANVVLENIDRVSGNDPVLYREILGEAHFIRGLYYFYLTQMFCLPYDPTAAENMLGIPLKYSSDITEQITRSNLQQTYQQIINDLEIAASNLPERSGYKTRASKAAAYAALSRVYLSMANYDAAEQMAVLSVASNDVLLDLNTINTAANFPFARANPEMLYEGYSLMSAQLLISNSTFVDSALYHSYGQNDLRKLAYFQTGANGRITYKGHYIGQRISYFAGFTVGEMYLTVAECLARRGSLAESRSYLNTLLSKRFKRDSFLPIESENQQELLLIILAQRRKDLLLKGVRWMDLRRLNKYDNAGITLRRRSAITGESKEYMLAPNDPRYCYPIPQQVIALSGIQQNER